MHHFFSILIFICHHILIKFLVAVAVWKGAHNFRTHSNDKEVHVTNSNFVQPDRRKFSIQSREIIFTLFQTDKIASFEFIVIHLMASHQLNELTAFANSTRIVVEVTQHHQL